MTGIAVLHRGATTPDAVLVQEAAAGSGVSYGKLYDRYAEQVFNYCLRLTGSPEDAGDATQEAFVNVLRRLQDDDRPVLEFSSYLFAAARHESYGLMRQRTRTHPSESPPAERGRVADLETDPERAALLRDSQEAVREANAKLAPRHREVLALREVAGRSYEEIGETLGISENAAAQLIWRARTKLKEALTAGAVASVVATSEECEWAQLLLSRVQDGEPVDEADRLWLKKHLDECDSCKTANRMLLEVGASYRCWLPVALFAGMRTETLTQAGELVGADWSHVPAPGKGAAAGSSAGGAAGTGVVAGAVAAVAAAAIAAAGIGGVALLGNDDAPPREPAAKGSASASAASTQSAPARKTDRKEAPSGPKLVAARASSSFAAPALAAAPAPPPDPPIEPPAPETQSAPVESGPPQDGPEQAEDSPEQLLDVGPGPDPPVLPDPVAEQPAPTDSVPATPEPVLPDPPVDKPTDCTGSGRDIPAGECPPGDGETPPDVIKDPPGDIKDPPDVIRDPPDVIKDPPDVIKDPLGDGVTPPGRQP